MWYCRLVCHHPKCIFASVVLPTQSPHNTHLAPSMLPSPQHSLSLPPHSPFPESPTQSTRSIFLAFHSRVPTDLVLSPSFLCNHAPFLNPGVLAAPVLPPSSLLCSIHWWFISDKELGSRTVDRVNGLIVLTVSGLQSASHTSARSALFS